MDKISNRIARVFSRLFAAEALDENLEILSLRDYADLPQYHPAADCGVSGKTDNRLHRRFSANGLDGRLSP